MAHPQSGMDWKVALGVGLLGYALSGVTGYFHEDKSVGTALAVTQSQLKDVGARVERVENKLDHFIELQTGARPDATPAQH